MFSSRRLGLFDSIPCPEKSTCTRNPCLFSHQEGLADPTAIHIPVVATTARSTSSQSGSGTPAKSILKSKPRLSSDVSVPAKRMFSSTSSLSSESPGTPLAIQQASPTSEPPRKIQRLDGYKRAQLVTASASQPVCLSSPHLLSLSLLNSLVIHTVPQNVYLLLIHFLPKRLESRLFVLILRRARYLFLFGRPVSKAFTMPSCTSLVIHYPGFH